MKLSSFEQETLDSAIAKLTAVRQRKLTDIEITRIKAKFIKHKNSPKPLDTVVIRDQGVGKAPLPCTPLEIANFAIGKNEPIMSAYGTFFKKHGKCNNYPAQMVQLLVDVRKAEKNEMHHYAETDPMYELHDNNQKVYKILGNSWYGALGQSSFIFYNPILGPSVTYAGVAIITSAIMGMEAWLGNNIKFLCYHDVVEFISNVCSEDYNDNISDYLDKDITRNELFEYLTGEMSSFSITTKQMLQIKNIVISLSPEKVNRLYYKRNLISALSNKRILTLVLNCMPKKGDLFNDPTKPLAYLIETLNTAYKILEQFVGYQYAYHDRFERSMTMYRKSVIVIDTDSTFLHLDPIFQHVCNQAGISQLERSELDTKINIANVITYFCSQYMQTVLDVHTNNIGIPELYQALINMKSEFLYYRVSTTKNKKSYAGMMLVREGTVFETPKIDLKGLGIKKVSTNKNTRDYFENVIKNTILGSGNDISRGSVLREFYSYEHELQDGLNKHKVDYLIPGKYGNEGNYAFPWRIMAFRGVFLWNSLYDEDQIQDYDKVRLAKLTISSYDDIANDDNISQKHKDIIRMAIFENDEVKHIGANVIALPMTNTEIPAWLNDYLNIDVMVSDNLNAAMPIFETMDLQVTTYKAKKYMTNILPMQYK